MGTKLRALLRQVARSLDPRKGGEGARSWHGYLCEWSDKGHWCKRDREHGGRVHSCFCGARAWVA